MLQLMGDASFIFEIILILDCLILLSAFIGIRIDVLAGIEHLILVWGLTFGRTLVCVGESIDCRVLLSVIHYLPWATDASLVAS